MLGKLVSRRKQPRRANLKRLDSQRRLSPTGEKLLLLALGAIGAMMALLILYPRQMQSRFFPTPVPTLVAHDDLWRTAVAVGWIGKDTNGNPEYCTSASGALLESVDVVVTNDHVAAYDAEYLKECKEPELSVGYFFDVSDTKAVWYPAEIRVADPAIDVAVLDVDLSADPWFERPKIDVSALTSGDWPVLHLAAADNQPKIGDDIQAFGFPSIGGFSLTYTRGVVAGWGWDFNDNPSGLMKLDLNVSHGSSGSALLNSRGEMVGVVSLLGVASDDNVDSVDCSPLADTNLDNKINDNDTCVSVGGFINGAVDLRVLRDFLEENGF